MGYIINFHSTQRVIGALQDADKVSALKNAQAKQTLCRRGDGIQQQVHD